MPGVVYHVQPQPPDPHSTRWIDAGAVRFGVEYRDVTPESLAATYAGNDSDMAEIVEHSPVGGFSDEGVSIHVCGTADGHEYLRFDVFDDEPHYHYVRPTLDHNNVVPFDPVADGDMLAWAIGRLRTRLADMLVHAGGASVSEALDPAVQGPAIDEVERLAVAAQAARRAARSG
jgi:hypothetical protein